MLTLIRTQRVPFFGGGEYAFAPNYPTFSAKFPDGTPLDMLRSSRLTVPLRTTQEPGKQRRLALF
jgi:hypothetical protein